MSKTEKEILMQIAGAMANNESNEGTKPVMGFTLKSYQSALNVQNKLEQARTATAYAAYNSRQIITGGETVTDWNGFEANIDDYVSRINGMVEEAMEFLDDVISAHSTAFKEYEMEIKLVKKQDKTPKS